MPCLFISYTEDVISILDSHQVNHLLYTDDKQAYVSVPVYNVSLARQTLEHCISDITLWCASRRLQLNAAKTELGQGLELGLLLVLMFSVRVGLSWDEFTGNWVN